MKKNKKRRKLRRANIFEFPAEVVVGGVNVCVYENCGCTIQNYTEMLDYTQKLLRVDSKIGVVRIQGEALQVAQMERGCIMLTGRVDSVTYERSEA